jgi:hypothetical protein
VILYEVLQQGNRNCPVTGDTKAIGEQCAIDSNYRPKTYRENILAFTGKILERYYRTKLSEEKRFTRIGGYWDRKGTTEIDLIAVNELEKYAEFIEMKRNAADINIGKLREKSYAFIRSTGELKDYRISYSGLSLKDM